MFTRLYHKMTQLVEKPRYLPTPGGGEERPPCCCCCFVLRVASEESSSARVSSARKAALSLSNLATTAARTTYLHKPAAPLLYRSLVKIYLATTEGARRKEGRKQQQSQSRVAFVPRSWYVMMLLLVVCIVKPQSRHTTCALEGSKASLS